MRLLHSSPPYGAACGPIALVPTRTFFFFKKQALLCAGGAALEARPGFAGLISNATECFANYHRDEEGLYWARERITAP